MLRNNRFMAIAGLMALMSCAPEPSNAISDQDNRKLDEAAAKLDAQTPTERAQSLAEEE